MRSAQSDQVRTIVGRLEKGDKLPDALIAVCQKHNIHAGEIRAIGAVTDLSVTEYDIEARKYRAPLVREPASEILMLYGNLSKKESELFAHLHITASYFEDNQTRIIAGHLASATVFACEYVIKSFDDLELERKPDEATDLMLWDKIEKRK